MQFFVRESIEQNNKHGYNDKEKQKDGIRDPEHLA